MSDKINRLEHKHKRYMSYLQYTVTIFVAIIASGIIFKDEVKEALNDVVTIPEILLGLIVILTLFVFLIHLSLSRIEDEIYPKEPEGSAILSTFDKNKYNATRYSYYLKATKRTLEEISQVAESSKTIIVLNVSEIPLEGLKGSRNKLTKWFKDQELEKDENEVFSGIYTLVDKKNKPVNKKQIMGVITQIEKFIIRLDKKI